MQNDNLRDILSSMGLKKTGKDAPMMKKPGDSGSGIGTFGQMGGGPAMPMKPAVASDTFANMGSPIKSPTAYEAPAPRMYPESSYAPPAGGQRASTPLGGASTTMGGAPVNKLGPNTAKKALGDFGDIFNDMKLSARQPSSEGSQRGSQQPPTPPMSQQQASQPPGASVRQQMPPPPARAPAMSGAPPPGAGASMPARQIPRRGSAEDLHTPAPPTPLAAPTAKPAQAVVNPAVAAVAAREMRKSASQPQLNIPHVSRYPPVSWPAPSRAPPPPPPVVGGRARGGGDAAAAMGGATVGATEPVSDGNFFPAFNDASSSSRGQAAGAFAIPAPRMPSPIPRTNSTPLMQSPAPDGPPVSSGTNGGAPSEPDPGDFFAAAAPVVESAAFAAPVGDLLGDDSSHPLDHLGGMMRSESRKTVTVEDMMGWDKPAAGSSNAADRGGAGGGGGDMMGGDGFMGASAAPAADMWASAFGVSETSSSASASHVVHEPLEGFEDGGDNDEAVEGEPEIRTRLRAERKARQRQRQMDALQEKLDRERKEAQENEERRALMDSLGPAIRKWGESSKGNIRTLLSKLHEVLWEGAEWTPVSLTDLMSASDVKRVYRRFLLKCHPDKISASSVEKRFISNMIFDYLKDAWATFQNTEMH
eukprot:jgi/Mesvir1/5357/Mv15442-RA.1